MASRNAKWTREELILALDLYFRHPPSHIARQVASVVMANMVPMG